MWPETSSKFIDKWKELFHDIEVHHRLDPRKDSHIWLLHFLFLPLINRDAMLFIEYWNLHPLASCRRRGEWSRVPRDMFIFDVLRTGARGFDPGNGFDEDEDVAIQDIQAYGIDWEAIDDHNGRAELIEDPERFEDEDVPVDPPIPILSEIEQHALHLFMQNHFDLADMSMVNRRRMWIAALAFAEAVVVERDGAF